LISLVSEIHIPTLGVLTTHVVNSYYTFIPKTMVKHLQKLS